MTIELLLRLERTEQSQDCCEYGLFIFPAYSPHIYFTFQYISNYSHVN